MTTIAIIGALDEEVAHIAGALADVSHDKAASLDVTRGTITTNAGGTIAVAATVGGMGLVNAAATTQRLIDAYAPDAVIFSGIAGNLNRELHINDVVLGGTLRYLDTDMRLVGQWAPGSEDKPVEEFHSDDRLLALADAALGEMGITHITGIIASGNYFVDDPRKVEQVIRETGADAVEMEGAAVAHVAARNGVPALVIRALSDNADTDYEVFKEFDISEYADTAARLAVNILRRL
ncbi:5'-methylthioadenosine/S-adenosylhomocysteine nucleosidase [Bifidobacterium jacchi]|uniref:adenosylhomocysteine nucleosidase n=1 Tax=Bifidobacterium jacchi TaxID=2490545 RepID=A0A5N5RG54_9BIFI|nr:5'-methylthioadenosine/S-adenosylhomocysteine nucleosidase [Bifidobacterium jacchi]KAB5606246.1 5'-methylthioadenosine/S-adenosylhomocysteine nucleosidase [Bifidobacterium jacchi]